MAKSKKHHTLNLQPEPQSIPQVLLQAECFHLQDPDRIVVRGCENVPGWVSKVLLRHGGFLEFRVPLWGPYKKDYIVDWGLNWGPLIVGNYHISLGHPGPFASWSSNSISAS